MRQIQWVVSNYILNDGPWNVYYIVRVKHFLRTESVRFPSVERFLWRSGWGKAWEQHTPTERLGPWMSGHPCETPWETLCRTPWETETFAGSLRSWERDSCCRFGGRRSHMAIGGHPLSRRWWTGRVGNSCAIQLKSIQSFLQRETQLHWVLLDIWDYRTEQCENILFDISDIFSLTRMKKSFLVRVTQSRFLGKQDTPLIPRERLNVRLRREVSR